MAGTLDVYRHRRRRTDQQRRRARIRHAVIYRKTCFGNQSDDGARFVERMLSIALTCKLQGRTLFAYLTHALEAAARGDPAPSLVPP